MSLNFRAKSDFQWRISLSWCSFIKRGKVTLFSAKALLELINKTFQIPFWSNAQFQHWVVFIIAAGHSRRLDCHCHIDRRLSKSLGSYLRLELEFSLRQWAHGTPALISRMPSLRYASPHWRNRFRLQVIAAYLFVWRKRTSHWTFCIFIIKSRWLRQRIRTIRLWGKFKNLFQGVLSPDNGSWLATLSITKFQKPVRRLRAYKLQVNDN